jgi:signal transduction histidine kinase
MNNDDKKEKPDLLKQMSSVVSHEIRNPLAIISNSLYFVKTKLGANGAALDPKIAKHLGIIEGEVKHTNAVIEEMLSFTRERELKRAPASANAAIKDLAGACPVPAAVKLTLEADPADPCVNADMEAIAYALRCVLDNSLQAMPEGGAVTVAVSHNETQALFTITDGGPGLPGGDGEKVFEPFFTTKPRGIGLGLTITRKLLEQQGGTARAENIPGGVRVTLALPLDGQKK